MVMKNVPTLVIVLVPFKRIKHSGHGKTWTPPTSATATNITANRNVGCKMCLVINRFVNVRDIMSDHRSLI